MTKKHIKNDNIEKESKIILYENKNGGIELHADIKEDTMWATQSDIAIIFDTTAQNVTTHLRKIYKEGELKKDSTCKESLQVQSEGVRSVKRILLVYNLDAIIAVGYRINSKKATQFRIWATNVLHYYLVRGYSFNRNEIAKSPEMLDGLREAIRLLESRSNKGTLKGKIIVRLTKDLTR